MYANYTIRKERKIYSSLQKAWDTLVQPENFSNWIGAQVESDLQVGSPITFSYAFYNKSYVDKGIIIDVEPMQILSYTYWSAFSGLPDEVENYSVVTFELQQQEDHIQLIMLHHDIHDKGMYEYFDKNWDDTLDNFKVLAEIVESYAIV